MKFWQCPFFTAFSSLFWSQVIQVDLTKVDKSVTTQSLLLLCGNVCVCIFCLQQKSSISTMELFAVSLNDVLRKNGFVEQDLWMDFSAVAYLCWIPLHLMWWTFLLQAEAFVLILDSEYRNLESSWPATAKRLCVRGEVVYWELYKWTYTWWEGSGRNNLHLRKQTKKTQKE